MLWRVWSCFLTMVVVFLGGCSSVKEELKPVPLQPIEAKLSLSKHWDHGVGKGQDARYARLKPAVHDGVAYTVDVRGRLTAHRVEDGSRLWEGDLDLSIGGGVGLYDTLGFVGALDGQVIAFDLTDGSVKWRSRVSSEVVSTPQSNGDVVIVSAIDGRVFGLDFETGERRWNYDHPSPILTLRSNSSPLVLENNAYVAFDNGQILSFDAASGQLNWATRIGQPSGKTELERLVDADTSPIQYGPYIYGAAYNSRLVAINRGTGRIEWASDVSTAQDIAASDNTIVVTDENSHIKAYDADSGSLLWENADLHRREVGPPAIYGSVVLVVDMDGYLHGLSLEEGTFVARAKISGRSLAQPLVVDDTVLIYNVEGDLTAVKVNVSKSRKNSNGTVSAALWEIPTDRFRGPIATKFTGVTQTQ